LRVVRTGSIRLLGVADATVPAFAGTVFIVSAEDLLLFGGLLLAAFLLC
jgi:hypothetical protein